MISPSLVRTVICNLRRSCLSPHTPQPFTVTPRFDTSLFQSPIKHAWAVRPCLSESARPAQCPPSAGSGPRDTAITLPSPSGRPAHKLSVWSHVLTIIHPAARCGSAAAPNLHLFLTAALLSVSYYDHSLSRGGTECLLQTCVAEQRA